jgi:O-Antigen ligase
MSFIGPIIVYLFLGIIFMIPVIMAVSVYAGTMLGSRHPFWLVIPYFVFIFLVPDASFGLSAKDIDVGANYYSRGVGLLGLPIINFILIGMFVTVMLSRYFKLTLNAQHNLGGVVRIFAVLIAGNVFVGLLLGYPFDLLIDHKGLRHFVNMLLAFYVVLALFRGEKDFKTFMNIFMTVAVLRGIFGAVRYAFMGGDPANFYANFEKVDVKLTFFDINDSFVATVVCFIAAWRLVQMNLEGRDDFWRKTMYWFIVVLEVFIVIFSFRRTAWIGFGFAALIFAYLQRKSLRNLLLVGYVAAGIPMVLAQTLKRMSNATVLDGGGFFQRIAPDLFSKSQYGPSNGRFVELQAAWDSISQYPVLGMGIWGSYNGYGIIALRFHKDDFSWMHSGILHIALKTGFVGVALIFWMWWRYGQFVRQQYSLLSKDYQGILLAFAAGYVFYMPTWFFGTPVIEFRTMQLMGMTMAMPYVIRAVVRSSQVRG